ncbi:MAG: DHH family phosphoesterase [Nanoarchaeota archaeon]|nr:DHH family phosphoesterase [Nanoarchaeota archaeon]MBU1005324.1 DHH family phosphoesterase [Nanoarchaeota archaeon]MBU1945504.1 DHH family phosphoesterase [Nanoarchaeota archaeon]
MDKYNQFKEYISISLEKFKEIDKRETIRLVSHLDADGICASAIMIKALNTDNRKYSVSIVQQLTKEVIDGLSQEPYNYYIFTDLGSGQLSHIKSKFVGKHVFILDHHQPEDVKISSNIVHVNPHLFGIDGGKEICGAGVVYLFVKSLNKKVEDLAHIAVIGSIGDMQEGKEGFSKLNKEILDAAVAKKKIKVIKGLRIFGAQTRPLYKVLEYCMDPYIPGVSGSESGSIQFLQQIGVQPKNGNVWRKLVHLDEDEIKKLVSGIILRRLEEDSPEDVLGNVYILNDEEKESPFRDAKEFSTLLNACGRLEKASLGIGACLGDDKTKERAIKSLNGYKREIVNAINWFKDNKDKKDIIKDKGYIIINAGSNIRGSIAGTLASILSKSNEIEDGTFIMSMADMMNGYYKVSLRLSGRNKDLDLRNIVKRISDKVGGEAGGHMNAAGAMIKEENVDEFVKIAKQVLGKKSLEEVVH